MATQVDPGGLLGPRWEAGVPYCWPMERPLPRASHALTPTHCPLWAPVSSPIIITAIDITIIVTCITPTILLMLRNMLIKLLLLPDDDPISII